MSLIIEPKTQFVGFDGRNRACSSLLTTCHQKAKFILKEMQFSPSMETFVTLTAFHHIKTVTTYLTL